MNFADSQAIISSIGWSLIHFLWQGTLITLLYWLITRTVQSIHAKYWTGMSLVLVSLIIPILNSYHSSISIDTINLTNLSAPIVLSYTQLSTGNLFYYLIEISLPYFVMIWGLTVMFLSFRMVKSWMKLASIKHECDPVTSGQLKQFVKNISIKLDLATIPILKVSREVLIPAAYGVFKPTVLLPLSLLNQIPKEQLEAIIKHELCHLKRNDFIHNIIQVCADILLFFHPGIRWMNNDIRHTREQCCDQMVLSHETEAITYAKALTNIASFTNNIKLKHSVHLGINDGMLLKRVKILLHNKSSQSSLILFLPIIFLIVFTIFLLQPNSSEHEITSTDKEIGLLFTPANQKSSAERITSRNLSQYNFYPSLDKKSDDLTTSPDTHSLDSMSSISLLQARIDSVENINSELEPQLNHLERSDLQIKEQPFLSIIDQPKGIIKNDLQEVIPATGNDQEQALNNSKESLAVTTKETQELNSFDAHISIMPKFKKYVTPIYPQQFWFNQIEQDVIATFNIKPNGKAINIKVNSQKNNFIAFEQEVIKAIRKWKFDPDSLNHTTLKRTYQQIFSFALSKDVEKNCEIATTGSRLKKSMPCNK